MFPRKNIRRKNTQGKGKKKGANFNNKRKNDHNRKRHGSKPSDRDSGSKKKFKFERQSETPAADIVETKQISSDSEEEEENQIEQLLSTFGKSTKYSRAVESDTSEDDDDEEAVGDIDEQVENDSSDGDDEVDDDNASDKEPDEVVATIVDDAKDNSEFDRHFLCDLSVEMLKALRATPMSYNTTTDDWPLLGKVIIQLPVYENVPEISNAAVSIEADKPFALPAKVPCIVGKGIVAKSVKTLIAKNIPLANTAFKVTESCLLSNLQREVFSIISNYHDLIFTERNFDNAELLRFCYCLHAANHILTTRNKVVHHNARLTNKDDVPEEFRDQGLVRPKILIIVPFRDAAYRVINMLIRLILGDGDRGSVFNKNRFVDEFTGTTIAMPKKNPKPEDYEQIFQGNSTDDFKIGLTVTKKSIKLYADFYSSDIIVASPLGLRFTIGAEGESERDHDFLNSIEMLILDQSELYLMQNYDHLLHVLEHLHLQPKDTHGTDLSRVRTWSLNGLQQFYRQTMIFSAIAIPELQAVFNKRCRNYHGRVRVCNPIVTGSISQVFVQLPHVYRKFESWTVTEAANDRFRFFTKHVLPQHNDSLMRQTMIFVASYFDFVRLRNYFKNEDLSFVQVCEYTKEGKVARARDMFFHGDAHFLLYTERHHFFNRIRLKGIRHLIFYQPPVMPHFYSEISNLMQEGNMNRKIGSSSNMTVTVLYCKYDQYQLEAIVGTERAQKMLHSDRNVYMLLTDGS